MKRKLKILAMKRFFIILKLSAILLVLVSCDKGSDKYQTCQEVFRQQRLAIKMSSMYLNGMNGEHFFYINGIDGPEDFLKAHLQYTLAENVSFDDWYSSINRKEKKKIEKEFIDYKKFVSKYTKKHFGDTKVYAYELFYNNLFNKVSKCDNYKEYMNLSSVKDDTLRWNEIVDESCYKYILSNKELSKKQLRNIKELEDEYAAKASTYDMKFRKEYELAKIEEERIAAEKAKIEAEKRAKKKAKAEADSLARVRAEVRQRELVATYKKKIPGSDYITDYAVRPRALSFMNRYDALTITIDLMGLYAMKMILAVEFKTETKCDIGCFYEADISQCNDRGSALHHSMWQDKLNKDQESLIERDINYSLKGDIIKIDGYGEWKVLKDTKILRNTSTGVELTRIDYKN